jgi:arylsulfatase A-like enzyme
MYEGQAPWQRPNCPLPPRDDLKGYHAQTTFLDDMVGAMLAGIERSGLDEDTIVLFTSDHGDMHGSHGVFKKQWPWDESIKVPFLLRYTGKIAAGRTFDFPVSAIDVMPTLLGLAGVPVPESVEGVDLSSRILGESAVEPHSVLLMNPCPFSIGDPRSPDQYPTFRGRRMEYRGVRTSSHTYVRTIDGPWLLYDNLTDPYQLRNLVDEPRHAGLAADLDAAMRSHMERIDDQFLPKEHYYERFGIKVDHRGKVAGIVDNLYDRLG